jgi:hypothetical protein
VTAFASAHILSFCKLAKMSILVAVRTVCEPHAFGGLAAFMTFFAGDPLVQTDQRKAR